MDAHVRNVRDSWKLGLENQWVKLSRQKILTTNNLLASEYNILAQKSLELYKSGLDNYIKLAEQGGTTSGGMDIITLSDQMANLIDFNRAFAIATTEVYKKTLEKAAQENISDPVVTETKEKILKDLFLIAQTTHELTSIANANRMKFDKLFKETDKIEFEEALFTFEDNYFLLKKSTQELLELGYQVYQELDISNQWVSKIKLALVQANPEQYCSILNLQPKTDQIVTDNSWMATDKYTEDWVNPGFNIASWKKANYVNENINQNRRDALLPIWFVSHTNTGLLNDSTRADVNDSTLALETDSLAGTITYPDSMSNDTTRIFEPNQFSINQNSETNQRLSNRAYFRKKFSISGLPVSADIKLTTDDSYNLFLNGKYVAAFTNSDSSSWQNEYTHQLADYLVEGRNVIAIESIDNDASGRGLIAILSVKYLPGWENKKQQIQLETSDVKIRQNLIMDKYIIMD